MLSYEDLSKSKNGSQVNGRKEIFMEAKRLGWCSQCKEHSTHVKIYKNGKRAEICVNKGHGFIHWLPTLNIERTVLNEKPLFPTNKGPSDYPPAPPITCSPKFCSRPKGEESVRPFLAG